MKMRMRIILEQNHAALQCFRLEITPRVLHFSAFHLCSGVIEGGRQVLDHLPVERERGITVKAQTASMIYQYSGHRYLLNLIDTPVSHHVLSYISSTCNIQKECIYTQVCNCHSISNGETICTT